VTLEQRPVIHDAVITSLVGSTFLSRGRTYSRKGARPPRGRRKSVPSFIPSQPPGTRVSPEAPDVPPSGSVSSWNWANSSSGYLQPPLLPAVLCHGPLAAASLIKPGKPSSFFLPP
jgi:hypothetical protein